MYWHYLNEKQHLFYKTREVSSILDQDYFLEFLINKGNYSVEKICCLLSLFLKIQQVYSVFKLNAIAIFFIYFLMNSGN